MKLLTISLLTISLLAASEAEAPKKMSAKMEGVKYIKMMGKELKTNVKKHMMADKSGLEAANFCAKEASGLAKKINEKLPEYAKVRRTSMKLRNKDNAADALDIKVMKEYMASMEAKTFTKKDVKVVADGDTTRVYVPVVVGDVCLKCHGENISADISKAIKAKFPDDKATGFKKGDLRGVMVAEIKKH